MSYIDVTGKTEDEALAKALEQLHLDRDDVSVQILERAKSGFLGLGSAPAKIRVTYGEEEAPVFEPAVEKKPAEKTGRPAQQPAAKAAEAVQKPAEPKPKPAPRQDRPAKRTPAAPVQKNPQPVENHAAPADLGPEVDDEKTQAIRAFLTGLLKQMEIQAEIHIYQPEKGRYKVILEGPGMGALIGRRGETLDAVQQLTSYAVNRGGAGRVRIQLDAENYRARREQSLQHLAQKVAGKVLKYHRSVTLEPMNAYERHVIHTALQEMPGITTYSTGTDPNRRVIVACDREKR